MHKVSFFLTFAAAVLFYLPSAFCQTEEIAISTYYPAPYGVYREMRSQRMAVGDNYINGSTYSWDTGTIDANADLVVEGNVGIGAVVFPATGPKLYVVGSAEADAFRAFETSGVYAFLEGAPNDGWAALGGYRVSPPAFAPTYLDGAPLALQFRSGGNVGIGTTSPSRRLEVWADTPNFPAMIRNTRSGPSVQGALLLVVAPNNDPTSSILDLYGANGADREFFFNSAGDGQADGNFGGGGADYAEYFENLNEVAIEKGTIVALESGRVRIARKDDDFIIGPVSTQPGFTGNNGDIEEEREKHPEKWSLVSLMGQVPVKVRGNIKHGDYVALDNDGIGRKVAGWHPQVIGRAMEDYDSEETGKIKVLVK